MLKNLFFSVAVNSSSGVVLFTRKNNFYCSFVISLFPLEPQWVSQGKRYLALLHYMSLRAFSNLFLNHRHSHGNTLESRASSGDSNFEYELIFSAR